MIAVKINSGLHISRYRYSTPNKQRTADNSTDIVKTKKQVFDEIKKKVNEMLDHTSGMSDEEKADYEAKINQKIKNGEKLSDTEMRYIQNKSPYMYALISRVQLQRETLKNKLKNCRSKEEVEEAYNTSMSHIDKKDPARVPLQAAYNNVMEEFKKSSEYKNLPQKTDDAIEKDKIPVSYNSKAEELIIESKYLQSKDAYSHIDFMA